MSLKNRKYVYDKLVAQGKEVPPSLAIEFDKPVVVKKKVKKDVKKE